MEFLCLYYRFFDPILPNLIQILSHHFLLIQCFYLFIKLFDYIFIIYHDHFQL